MPCGRAPARTAARPAGAIAGSRRSTAATGAAAPSSAQLSPPNAIIDVPTAPARRRRPRRGRCGRRRRRWPATRTRRRWRATTSSRLQSTGRSRSRVASYCSSCRRRAARDEAVDRPAGEAEQPQLLAGRRIDGEPVGVVGVALRAAHLVGVAVAPDRALAQQPVRGQPGAARARAAPTTRSRRARRRDARPPIISTSPPAMKSIEIDSGGPGHAEVEVARDGEVAGELRVLEVPHARRAHAGLGEPVVEPGRGAVAEVGADRLVDRA